MLKPDPKDPNYKELMKQYEKDPSSWGPGGPVGRGQADAPSREEIEREMRPQIEAELIIKLQAQFDDGVEAVKQATREELLGKLPKKLRETVEVELGK